MQPQPTAVQIMADVYRRHLLREADLVRPKLCGRTGDLAQPVPAGDVGDGRVLAALCAASFLVALNFLAPTPFYPQMAGDLETTVALLGQVVTLMVLISAALGFAVGPVADRYGYRWPLVGGVLAIAVNLVGTGLAPSYPVLLGLSVVGGLADALVFGLPLAIAGSRFAGDARRRAMGWTIGSLSSGAIVGVPLLTAIGAVISWRGALIVGGVGAAGAAWWVAMVLPPDGRRPAARGRVRALLGAYTPLLRHPATLRLYGNSALRAAWWFGLLTYLGAFLADSFELSTRQIGLVYILGGGGHAVGSVAASGWLGRASPRASVGIASLIAGLLVGLMPLLADVWAAVPLLAVLAGASASAGIAIATLLAAESPAGAGTTMVLNGSVLNLGGAGGAAAGGALIALGGYDALGLGLALFAWAAAVLAWWPARRREGASSAGH